MRDLDVLVIGAGLSGVAAGYYLQAQCPGKTYAILEARDAMGGTWDLFRYPGFRSDSDLYTFGFSFRPWTANRSIADGASILRYVRDTAAEYGIDRKVCYGHRVLNAAWSTAEARWHVQVEIRGNPAPVHFTCRFLFGCAGYYNYDQGYMPGWPGMERFQGPVVHPQALYRPRIVRHRSEAYAAKAAGGSCAVRMAAGGRNPCRSISHVSL